MIDVNVNILDAVHCQTDRQGIELLFPCLSHDAVFYVKTQYRNERREYKKSLITKKGIFMTGHLPRIRVFCTRRKYNLIISGTQEKILPENPPKLPAINFRPDQIFLLEKALKEQRGVIKAPTGSGKTLLIAGIMGCYPSKEKIIMTHQLSIIDQIVEELKIQKVGKPTVYAEGIKQLSKLTVASIQSMVNVNPREYSGRYDLVMVDEAHHVSDYKGIYMKVLENMIAPVRLGTTATVHSENSKEYLAMEGALGPVIGEISINDGIEEGFLAMPKIRIERVPFNREIKALKTYMDVYNQCVVHNRSRNRLIATLAKNEVLSGGSVLILVNIIEHGHNIKKVCDVLDVGAPFIHGETETEDRNKVKKDFISGKIRCVIASTIWREGVNVPNINCLINACGGKDEIPVLQSIGRGLRVTNDKKEVIIVDFLDNSHWRLIDHLGHRLAVYSENGWL